MAWIHSIDNVGRPRWWDWATGNTRVDRAEKAASQAKHQAIQFRIARDYASAAEAFVVAAEWAPEDFEKVSYLKEASVMFRKTGASERALQCLTSCAELCRASGNFKMAMTHALDRVATLEEMGRLEQARDALVELADDPEAPRLKIEEKLARLSAELELWDDAVRHWEAVADLTLDAGTALRHLAQEVLFFVFLVKVPQGGAQDTWDRINRLIPGWDTSRPGKFCLELVGVWSSQDVDAFSQAVQEWDSWRRLTPLEVKLLGRIKAEMTVEGSLT